jgi:hypothetical protein
MPYVGFEPTILMFERAKTVHVLDRAATVLGLVVTQPFVFRRSRVRLFSQSPTDWDVCGFPAVFLNPSRKILGS